MTKKAATKGFRAKQGADMMNLKPGRDSMFCVASPENGSYRIVEDCGDYYDCGDIVVYKSDAVKNFAAIDWS